MLIDNQLEIHSSNLGGTKERRNIKVSISIEEQQWEKWERKAWEQGFKVNNNKNR